MSILLGNPITLTYTFRDLTKRVVDPTSIQIVVTPPAPGAPTTYNYGSGSNILQVSTGVYAFTFELDTYEGDWVVLMTGDLPGLLGLYTTNRRVISAYAS